MAPRNEESLLVQWKCILACSVMVLFPFQYGLDFGLIGGLQAMIPFLQIYGHEDPTSVIGWNISTERQQLISSFMTLGAFISSGLAGVAAVKFGRKMCLWGACILCAVSNVLMMATTSIGALYAGRLLIGLANGYFMTFSQLYIQECSPARYRGLFLTAFHMCTSIGSLVGTIVDWATAPRPDRSSYLIPLGVVYLVPTILFFILFFIPESPRWLILQGRYEDGLKSLARLRPDGANIEEEAKDIQNALDNEREMTGNVSVWDMFTDPIDRRRTVVAACAITIQAASGAMFVIAYQTYFLTMARISDPFAMTNVIAALGIMALIVNAFIVVRWGSRRYCTFNGLMLCGVLQLAIAVVYQRNPGTVVTGKVIVALSCLYIFFYNGFIAPYAWLAGGEIPSPRLRSHTFGFATAVGFLGAWLTTFTAPYFINPDSLNWGPKYGYIWFPSCTIAALWVFFFLPETKNRTLEEIDEMFRANLPAWKFKGYKTVGVTIPEKDDSGKEAEVQVQETERV